MGGHPHHLGGLLMDEIYYIDLAVRIFAFWFESIVPFQTSGFTWMCSLHRDRFFRIRWWWHVVMLIIPGGHWFWVLGNRLGIWRLREPSSGFQRGKI